MGDAARQLDRVEEPVLVRDLLPHRKDPDRRTRAILRAAAVAHLQYGTGARAADARGGPLPRRRLLVEGRMGALRRGGGGCGRSAVARRPAICPRCVGAGGSRLRGQRLCRHALPCEPAIERDKVSEPLLGRTTPITGATQGSGPEIARTYLDVGVEGIRSDAP